MEPREIDRIATSVARYAPDQFSVAMVENHYEQDRSKEPLFLSGVDLCQKYPTLREPVIHGLLRGAWRYQGVVVSDALEMGALDGTLEERALRTIMAAKWFRSSPQKNWHVATYMKPMWPSIKPPFFEPRRVCHSLTITRLSHARQLFSLPAG